VKRRTADIPAMARWITDWPHGRKWGSCSAAMAAQIAADGRRRVALVETTHPLSRHILAMPAFAQSLCQRAPAVAMARRLALR
jgi:hypothetical protein